MTKQRAKYSCDFETTTDPNDCRVWAWIGMEIGDVDNYMISNNIDSFMEWCQQVTADLYFHNLRFDGEFIINWLQHNGFKYSEDGEPMTYKTVISSMGQFYMIDITYKRIKDRPIKTTIYDSLKKIPFPVAKIAKSFDLPILKGKIDYDAYRPVGHILTKEEIEYIKNDAEIVARALEIQFNEGFTRMTTSSDSLHTFKQIVSTKVFNQKFPTLSLELDAEIRQAYKGGFTWLNSKYANLHLTGGIVFDVNSLYPSQMRDRLLPYGHPTFFEGEYVKDDDFPLYIQKITCAFELKPRHIPTIQIKKNLMFRQNEYLESSNNEVVELCLPNIDLELFFEHYDVDELEFHGGWKFRGMVGMFNEFIDKYMEVKKREKGGKKELAKLVLNALYGKFASNPDVTGKMPYLKEDGSTGYRMKDPEFKDPVYTPMGVFITSWARYTTITAAQKCYDRIIYCDTDSIHLVGLETPEAIADVIDPDELGYWKYEGAFKYAKYLRQKTYYHAYYAKEVYDEEEEKMVKVQCEPEEATTEKHSVKCAGMTDDIKKTVTFDNFKIGFSSNLKLYPQHVKGGVILKYGKFEIR